MTRPPSTTPALVPEQLIEAAKAEERRGRRPLARSLYEAALFALRDSGRTDSAAAVLRWIARTHLEDGAAEAAAEVAAVALLASSASGDHAGVAQAENLLGNVERERGDLDAADALYARARRNAAAAGEQRLLAMVEQNMGILSNIRGDYRTALKRYRASLSAHRQLGPSPFVAHALNNVGMLCTDLGRYRAADRAFVEALALCEELGDAPTEARIAGNRIEVLIAQRRWDEAAGACARAARIAEAAGETAALGEVHRHRGVIARELGSWEEAEEHFRRAAAVAEARSDLLLGAETARERARLAWLRGHSQDTLQALNRAHRLFSRLQARRDVADVKAGLSDLEGMFLSIVAQWGQSIESVDRYTQGHCERVARYACALAPAAGIEPEHLLWFRMGALLHDVGKIAVPPEILNKTGSLTPEEWRVMQQHPDAGVALLAEVDFPWDIRPMVRHHHEAWNGSGYPAGLSGEAIPLSARILAVADVYDALTTDRAYRPAYSTGEALAIMEKSAGSALDPAIFGRFRELVA